MLIYLFLRYSLQFYPIIKVLSRPPPACLQYLSCWPWNSPHPSLQRLLLPRPEVTKQRRGQSRAGDTLTQARGLLPLDLRELGDGVGPVAVGEDDTQLLADHFVLREREQRTLLGLCTPSAQLLPGTRSPRGRSPQTYPRPQESSPWTSLTPFARQALELLACLSTVYFHGLIGKSLICNETLFSCSNHFLLTGKQVL